MNDQIIIRGAREHNLRNVSLTVPRDKLVVFTGLSGSGKSSLAFDTIYAEGQRRYVESLSSYARQFLGQMEKPDVDQIDGLSPAISIDQKTTSHNPRSTVGTVTEIYDYLRLMYARIGVPHCPVCGRVISQQTVDEMVDEVLKLPERTRFQVLAPVVRGRKGTQAKELDAARRENDMDEELQNMIGEFNLARLDLNNESAKAETDAARVAELNQRVNDLYSQIMASEGMVRYNAAKAECEAMVSHIDAIINTAMNGGDPMTVQAPTGGCTGSCSTCGGCH